MINPRAKDPAYEQSRKTNLNNPGWDAAAQCARNWPHTQHAPTTTTACTPARVVVVDVAVPALTWAEGVGKAGDRTRIPGQRHKAPTVMDGHCTQGLCGIEGAARTKNAHGLDQAFLMRMDSHNDG
jgi:hypothetical protein